MKSYPAKHGFLSVPSKIISLVIFIAALLLLSALLTGCSAAAAPVSRTEFHLNTVVSITLYDTHSAKQDAAILDGCMSLIEKYERIFSRTDPSSELYKLNHGLLPKAAEEMLDSDGMPAFGGMSTPGGMPTFGGQMVSDELAELIELGLYYSKLSGGAFDITIAPVSDLWNFGAVPEESLSREQEGISAGGAAADGAVPGAAVSVSTGSHAVPDAAALADALRCVDYRNVTLSRTAEGSLVTFSAEGMSLDLGAVAKGYIADRLREYLLENGVENAIINLGGNVLCMGSKNGQPYKVGIQKPFAAQGESIAVLSLTDISLVSSGTYERYFESEGNFYHHILDPSTGYPCRNGLSGVTILAGSSAEADALSTVCFLLGPERGLALIESLPEAEALFITDAEELIYSSGFPH